MNGRARRFYWVWMSPVLALAGCGAFSSGESPPTDPTLPQEAFSSSATDSSAVFDSLGSTQGKPPASPQSSQDSAARSGRSGGQNAPKNPAQGTGRPSPPSEETSNAAPALPQLQVDVPDAERQKLERDARNDLSEAETSLREMETRSRLSRDEAEQLRTAKELMEKVTNALNDGDVTVAASLARKARLLLDGLTSR